MFAFLLIAVVLGCSDFQLRTNDGSLIYGRTMDFPINLQSQLMVFNRGYEHCSTDPNGNPSTCWIGDFGFVGINAFNIPLVTEGMNEKGLLFSYE